MSPASLDCRMDNSNNTRGAKIGLYFRSDNFATSNDRKACNMSQVSEFCLE